MKKIIFTTVVCCLCFVATALELTSHISEIPPAVWVSNKGLSLAKEAKNGKYVMLVLARQESPQTVRLLPEMQEIIDYYSVKISYAILFENTPEDIRKWSLFKAMPDCAVGADTAIVRTLRDGREQPLLCIIIDTDGKVVWIGSPMVVRPVLAAIHAGTFNVEALLAPMEDKVAMEEYLQEGNYSDALAACERILAASPGNEAMIAAKFRIIFSGLAQQEEAISYLKKEIGKDPDNLTLRQLEIACYRELGYQDRIDAACDNLAGMATPWFLIVTAKSILEAQNPDLRNAIVFLNAAMTTPIDSEKAEAMLLYARACQLAGKINMAVQYQEEAVKLLPPVGAETSEALEKLEYYRNAAKASGLLVAPDDRN